MLYHLQPRLMLNSQFNEVSSKLSPPQRISPIATQMTPLAMTRNAKFHDGMSVRSRLNDKKKTVSVSARMAEACIRNVS